MKEDKKAKDNSRIMRRLLDGGSYTTLQIAEQVGLSEKTVRTKMTLSTTGWRKRTWDGLSAGREKEYGWRRMRTRKSV